MTPFSPADWQLTFDGTVSMSPSIGNWQYPCQSHYFIRSNHVVWARHFAPDKITRCTRCDTEDRQAQYGSVTGNRIRRWFSQGVSYRLCK